MSFHWLAILGVWLYIAILGVIVVVALTVILWCLLLGYSILIDKYQEGKRRPMATSMPRDELLARRIAKTIERRIKTIKAANSR